MFLEIIMDKYGPHVCPNCYGYKKVCPNCHGLLTHAHYDWGSDAEGTWYGDSESILFCRKCEPTVKLCKKEDKEKAGKLDRETVSKLVYYERIDIFRSWNTEEKFDKSVICPKCSQ